MDEQGNPTIVKSVFGRDINVSELLQGGILEAIAPVDQLKLEDTDPQFVYGWLDTRDESTAIKLRKGIWQAVSADEIGGPDQVKVAGLTGNEDGYVHVRELLLVKMPREKHEAIGRAYLALSLRREQAVSEQFTEQARAISKNFGDDVNPILHKTEETKAERHGRITK